MKIVIMAGGGGTRLWPLSREKQPKQFSRIIGDRTMFEETVARFVDEFDYNDIYVSLNNQLVSTAQKLVPEIPIENYIIEPEKRDTAPAMGFIAAKLFQEFPDEPIVYVPADHYIANKNKFIESIKLADKIIRETGKMVDIAIQPTFPSTVLGYTKIGQRKYSEKGIDVYEFLGHTEKPVFDIARQYVESGDYLWHASYYMWTPRKILESFAQHSPVHYNVLKQIVDNLTENSKANIDDLFIQMEKISFDYAITEKIDPSQVYIIKGDFGWSDVGAFDVLAESLKTKMDKNHNLIQGNWIGEKTSNCLVYNLEDKLIATLGIEDLVIINTEDVTLVCPKSKSQEVKQIVKKLKDLDQIKYL